MVDKSKSVGAGALGANYHRLWAASAVSNLGDGVLWTAIPLLALRLTDSPGLVAGAALAARLPWLLFALHAGCLADRLDRRRTMVRVDLARVVLLGGLALAVALDAASLPLLYAVAFLLGIGETLFDTSAQAIMPAVVERDQLSRANGRLYAAEIVTNQFVGPPLGGLLAGAAMASAFFTGVGAYAVAAVALAAMAGTFRPPARPAARLRHDIAAGLRYLFSHRLLRTLALMLGAMNMASNATFAVFVVYVVTPGPVGLSEAGYGLLLTTAGIGGVAGSLAGPRLERRFGRSRLLFIAVAGIAAMVGAPALTSSAVVIGMLWAAGATASTVWNIITVSLRQRIIPPELLGRVNSAYRLLGWGTIPIGAGIGGLLAGVVGLRATFAVAGIVSLVLLIPALRLTEHAIQSAEAEAAESGSPTE